MPPDLKPEQTLREIYIRWLKGTIFMDRSLTATGFLLSAKGQKSKVTGPVIYKILGAIISLPLHGSGS